MGRRSRPTYSVSLNEVQLPKELQHFTSTVKKESAHQPQ